MGERVTDSRPVGVVARVGMGPAVGTPDCPYVQLSFFFSSSSFLVVLFLSS